LRMSLLPVRVLERVARSDASLVRRQAVGLPVAALLASAQGVGVVAVGGGREVEDVVLVDDVLVGDWGWDGEGAGQEGEEGESESETHVGLRFVGRLLGRLVGWYLSSSLRFKVRGVGSRASLR
jgi:hypothetical protein